MNNQVRVESVDHTEVGFENFNLKGVVIHRPFAGTSADRVRTNSIKVFIIASYTIVAIIIFALNGKIDWKVAAVVAVTQGIGGYVGTRIAIKGGEKLIKKLIFAALLLMAVTLFLR